MSTPLTAKDELNRAGAKPWYEKKDFKPFRFCVFEYDGEDRHVKFEIIAMTPYKFDVRFPEFDYIRTCSGPCVEYERNQLLCFLLAFDKKQCYEFMVKLHKNCGMEEADAKFRLSGIPIFNNFLQS